MSDIILDVQSPSVTPSSGKVAIYADSMTKLLSFKNDAGYVNSLGGYIGNFSVTSQTGFAADTYLAGSNIVIPQHRIQTGTTFWWMFDITKTAAGIAAPTVNIRVGTLGTTADTSRVLFTLPAQTAAVDAGTFIINALVRNSGAVSVMVGQLVMTHNVPAGITGLSTSISPNITTVSAAFDTDTSGLIVGLSVNGGGSAAWTTQIVTAAAAGI